MARRHGNPAIVSVGDRRRTGADGRPVSHGTQAAFNKFKRDFNRRLQAVGFHQLRPRNLKPKHIKAVVELLRTEVESGRPFDRRGEELDGAFSGLCSVDRQPYLVPGQTPNSALATASTCPRRARHWC